MVKARIVGVGSYLPEKVMTNKDFEKIVDTSDQWITERTGIKSRHIAADDEFSSTMGYKAALRALDDAGLTPDQIDLIVVATLSPDYPMPSTGAVLQEMLGLQDIPAFDAQAACSGHLYGLSIAKAYVESGMANRVLLVSTEKLSSYLDYTDRSTCILFGDGAGAAVIANSGAGYALGPISLGADGRQSHLLEVPGGGCRCPASVDSVTQKQHTLKMVGREVYKNAVRRMIDAGTACLKASGDQFSDIDWLIPHQANVRIIEAVAKRLDFPEERVYSDSVKHCGNTSAASVAIAMDELLSKKEIAVGGKIMLIAFGAGFTWGGVVLTKIDA